MKLLQIMCAYIKSVRDCQQKRIRQTSDLQHYFTIHVLLLKVCSSIPMSFNLCHLNSIQCTFKQAFLLFSGIPSAFYSDECVKRRKKSLAILQDSLPKEHLSAETFGLLMDAFTNTCVDAIVNAFDLSCHKAAVDLGGELC